MDQHFSHASLLNDESFFIVKNIFFLSWSHHLFLFIFRKENKTRKKTLGVIPYERKSMSKKIKSKFGVKLLIENVSYDNTPLSLQEISTKQVEGTKPIH